MGNDITLGDLLRQAESLSHKPQSLPTRSYGMTDEEHIERLEKLRAIIDENIESRKEHMKLVAECEKLNKESERLFEQLKELSEERRKA